ncbi:hypothetical protein B0F90DRAFT_1666766 [Multifurca ochricompacta]|uniref:Ubiquitin-like domain-containing protein n=1 Tax=Multifurca ochricompacta TaxID=376703 RepID=A0AAD4QN11_9AGAM|nr:hypothetical protein B0F90DRAFT_1666766 [Multifurca ochricompacta]
MDHHLTPPLHPPHRKVSLPTFAKSIPVEVTTLPASTRTSFTRVDNTRPGTSAGDDIPQDEGDSNDDGARAPPHDGPEEASVPQIPQTLLQFLLVSGRRRSMAFEPETTVGRVKELVWNTWPNDWQDERPPAPSFLRVLYLGKILQDDDTLAQLKFSSYTPPEPATPTIVHLSIRSFAPREDSALKKKRRMSRSGLEASGAGTDVSASEQAGGCCCVIWVTAINVATLVGGTPVAQSAKRIRARRGSGKAKSRRQDVEDSTRIAPQLGWPRNAWFLVPKPPLGFYDVCDVDWGKRSLPLKMDPRAHDDGWVESESESESESDGEAEINLNTVRRGKGR